MFRGGSKSRSKTSKPPEKKAAKVAATIPENGIATPTVNYRTHHFVFVFSSFEEFTLEFDVIRAVMNDMQQYLFDYDMDIECSTFISESPTHMAEFVHLMELVKSPQTTVVGFIGDKYGPPQIPLKIDHVEFGCLRATAVEISQDAKLLEQCYIQTQQNGPFYLNTRKSTDEMKKLTTLIRKATLRALEDGTLVSANGEKSMGLQFQTSFVEKVAQKLMEQPLKHLLVLRKFKDVEAKSEDCIWKDFDANRFEKVAALKNKISEKMPKEAYISHVLNTKNMDPSRWLTGKDAGIYERQLTMDLITSLKKHVTVLPRVNTNVLSTDQDQATRDHQVHLDYLKEVAGQVWVSRKDDVDDRISEVIKKGMEKPHCVLFHGPPGSGKSATIARFYNLLKSEACYVIPRFTQLTDCSMYANELLKGIFLTLCEAAKVDATPMNASFTLPMILSQAMLILEKVDKPVFILLDNANHLKFGRSLSEAEKPLAKLLPKTSIIYTGNVADLQISCFPMADEVVPLGLIQGEVCLEILKNEMNAAYGCLDNVGMVQQMHKSDSLDLTLGRLQARELKEVSPVFFKKLEQYLQRLEEQYDAQTVRIMCQMLAVSPFGLTLAELADGVRLAKFQNGVVTKAQHLFSPMPQMVFRRIAQLCVPIHIQDRIAYRIRHPINAVLIRQKYMQTATELIKTHEIMSELFKTGPNLEVGRPNAQSAGVINYPPAITKDSRSLRRLRYSWYYLLHSANIDELKTEALCAFEYIEGVFQFFGLTRLLTIFEECLQQVLHHDLLVLFEQILLPAIPTLIHDGSQFVSEFINRLRYRRAMNSSYLNELIEQAMLWTDFYTNGSLLVPMTCWIPPPKMKQVVSFEVPFQATKPILHPTCNHQHLLITGDNAAPGVIYMYHIASQVLFKTFKAHTDRVTSFQTSSDGTFFTSTSCDTTVRVWSILNLECSKTIKWSESKVLCSALAEDDRRLIVGSADSTARIIDLETGKVVKSFPDHIGPVVDLKLMSKDELLVTGSGDFAVMVWDLNTGMVITKMVGLMAPVTCLTVTSNDAFLAVACEDETLRVFSTVSTQELHELSGHDSRVNALCSTIDDCKLFAATTKKIVCYDVHNGQILELLECSQKLPVTSLKISDDNSFLLASCGSRMHMWDVNSIENEPMVNSAASLICMKLAPDERTAACGTEDGVLAVWDLDGCRCLWTTSQQKSGAVTAVEFTVDSMFVLSGSAQGSITMWETSSGQLTKQFDLHNEAIVEIVCFTDGNNVLTVDRNDAAFIWSLSSSEDPSQIEILSSFTAVRAPVFVRLEDSVIISYNTQNIKEVNVWTQYDAVLTIKTKAHHSGDITCYHANQTGTTFATGSADNSLKIWRVDTGFLTQVLVGHDNVVLCCYCSHDGKSVASGGKDKQGFVWCTQTGQSRLQYTAKGAITCIQLTHDGSIVISGDDAGWIEAYYVPTQQLLSSFNAHRPVEGLLISMEAHRILAKLAHTAQMPILCLHNTPAGQYRSERHRLHTLLSTNSLTTGNEETVSLTNFQRPRSSVGDIAAQNRPATTVINVMEIKHDTVVSNVSNGSKPDKNGRKSNVLEKSQSSTVSASGDTKTSTSNTTAVAKKSKACNVL